MLKMGAFTKAAGHEGRVAGEGSGAGREKHGPYVSGARPCRDIQLKITNLYVLSCTTHQAPPTPSCDLCMGQTDSKYDHSRAQGEGHDLRLSRVVGHDWPSAVVEVSTCLLLRIHANEVAQCQKWAPLRRPLAMKAE